VIDIDKAEILVSKLNKIHDLFTYFECPNFIFLQFFKGGRRQTILYDTKTGHSKLIWPSIKDDLVYKPSYNPAVSYSNYLSKDQKGIYSYINLYGIAAFIEERDKGELSPSLQNNPKIQKLTEDSNPLIFYYEFND
jgi:hypothetical protein